MKLTDRNDPREERRRTDHIHWKVPSAVSMGTCSRRYSPTIMGINANVAESHRQSSGSVQTSQRRLTVFAAKGPTATPIHKQINAAARQYQGLFQRDFSSPSSSVCLHTICTERSGTSATRASRLARAKLTSLHQKQVNALRSSGFSLVYWEASKFQQKKKSAPLCSSHKRGYCTARPCQLPAADPLPPRTHHHQIPNPHVAPLVDVSTPSTRIPDA